ncbi:MAG TPA: two-component regulator propeller domain-containing protein [Chitinophagaceae bacterium]|nr:two-component regulator propeller domain-containing protein [Chitinophagaceae bacterium]
MKKIIPLFIFLLSFIPCFCQELQQVPHCPSNEIYDMMIDKKGFLWIAHSLGVSRYDGISFKSFSNPAQSAVGATGLLEDDYGRIWFSNFNGQVFYIKDEKMVQLKEYDFKSSYTFPHMVLLGKDLVISCKTGLFICNTANMHCEYKTGDNKHPILWKSYSLGVLKNKLLVNADDFWYTYNNKEGFHKLRFAEVPIKSQSRLANIQTKHLDNTCFVLDSSGHILYGLSNANDKITLSTKINARGFINTISIIGNKVWINTFLKSYAISSKDSISNYNLSSIVADKNGNTWYGSLSDGLWVSYKSNDWKKNMPIITNMIT